MCQKHSAGVDGGAELKLMITLKQELVPSSSSLIYCKYFITMNYRYVFAKLMPFVSYLNSP